MIEIGNILIDREQVAAVYPSMHTPGKLWIALRSGRTVWTMATMEEARAAMEVESERALYVPKVLTEIRELESLLRKGFAFLARDEIGKLYAFVGDPLKNTKTNCWDAEIGDCIPVREDLFDGVVEWQDSKATKISVLLAYMRRDPAMFED